MYSTRAHSFIDRTTLPSISTRTSLSNIETKQKCTHIPDFELSAHTQQLRRHLQQFAVVVEVHLQVLGSLQLVLARLRLLEQRVPGVHHLLVLAGDVLLRVGELLQQLLRLRRDALHL